MAERLFMTLDEHPRERGKYIAVITDTHPRKPTKPMVTVLTVTVVGSKGEAHRWFAEQSATRPWETRQ